jgi:ABC-type transport system substrate-binding protein
VVSDPSQQLAQFESGDADIIEGFDPALAPQVDEAQQLVVNPASKNMDVIFNWASPLGQDQAFREAVSKAINRDQLVEIAYDGLATPAAGILPPGTIGSVGCDCDAWDYDPEGAKAALEASSYGGEELHLITAATSGDSPQLELIRADLEAAGIKVAVEELDIQVLIQRVGEGDYDIGIGTYSNVSPTAGDVFFYMFVTKFFGSGAPVDQVLTSFNEFATAADADAKGEAVQGLEAWAAETRPIVPVVSLSLVVPVNERVKGLTVRPYNRYYLDELSVG